MIFKKSLKYGLILSLLLILVLLYRYYNPINYTLFPDCIFKRLTGYECPGCGSQRALHSLLNFDFYGALRHNFLVVTALPYIAVGILFDFIKNPSTKTLKIKRYLYGKIAVVIVFIAVITFWIVRNL